MFLKKNFLNNLFLFSNGFNVTNTHLFIIIVVFAVLFSSCNSKIEENYSIKVGISKLPELECYDMDNKKEVLSHREGEILILNFWGIACKPCILEIPGFNKLVEKYKKNKMIRFIALHTYHGNTEKIKFFLERNKFDFQQKLISLSSAKRLNITAVPTTIICNQQGIVLYEIIGGHANMYKYIDKIIETLLNGGLFYYELK